MKPPIDVEKLKSNWYKFDNYKELERVMGNTRGSLFRKAKELGLVDWSRRIGYLNKMMEKCECCNRNGQ